MVANTGISIFNKYTDSLTKKVVFKKHYIDKAFWDDTKTVFENKGFDKMNEVAVYILKSNAVDYVKPKNYNGENWTLNIGDFIVKGQTVETEINGIKDLSSYEAFTITSVSDKDFGSKQMHHFEIRGN